MYKYSQWYQWDDICISRNLFHRCQMGSLFNRQTIVVSVQFGNSYSLCIFFFLNKMFCSQTDMAVIQSRYISHKKTQYSFHIISHSRNIDILYEMYNTG